MKARLPTITDVARRAEVSICTVSRVLAGGERAKPYAAECVGRVRAAADALGYRPHRLAQALRSRRSEAVGLLVDSPLAGSTGHFSAAMLAAVDRSVRAAGYFSVMIGNTGEDPVGDAERFFADGRIDALVVAHGALAATQLRRLEALARPVVLMDHHGGDTALPSVGLDPAPGIEAAIARLAELGHRAVAWLGNAEHPAFVHAGERLGATRAAATRQGMACTRIDVRRAAISTSETELEASRAAVAGRLAAGHPPTAILCYNDLMALGACAALAAAGLRVGRDVVVVGFDDVLATLASPALPSISHRIDAIGSAAVELAVAMAGDAGRRSALHGHRRLVPSVLVRGDALAPPRDASPSLP